MAEENNKEKKDLIGNMKDMKIDYNSIKSAASPQDPNNQGKGPVENPEEKKKEMDKIKKDLEGFKEKIIKKFKYVFGMGIIPPQAADKFEEEENVPEEERKKKPINLVVLIPEEKYKNIKKIQPEMVEMVKELKQNVWLHIKTPVDVWNYGLDGKYEMASAVSMAYPLYDKKGFLGSLRVAEIHKNLVLRKFEKYVTSYVIAGSLVRGDTTKTSDVDVYVIIDDTDVKRMPRLQLKEKLRGIIHSYILEASELAGVKNKLNVQTYILTEFWEGVKDANPVFFTFIRDGVPFYDGGTFMPWKLLLKMGKITPSAESIDKFMMMGDQVDKRIKATFMDAVIKDIYWGVLTPAQALLMLYGMAPPTPKETPKLFLKTFVEKEKLLEKRYANILEKIVKVYKDFEHKKVKDGDINGKDVDKYLKDANDFLKRLKELRKQIEKTKRGKIVEDMYEQIFGILKENFGKKSEEKLIEKFKKEFVKKGKMPENKIKVLKEASKLKKKAKNKTKKDQLKRQEVEKFRKNSIELVNDLIEYNQRCELVSLEKGNLRLKTKDKEYGLVLTSDNVFLIDSSDVNKLDLKNKKIVDATQKELNEALNKQSKETEVKISQKVFDILKKELGEFEVIL